MVSYVHIKNEIQKIGSVKLVIAMFTSVFVTFIFSSSFIEFKKESLLSNNMMEIQPAIQSINAYFACFILIVFSAITWYYIISLENKNGTWSILLTIPIPKRQLLFTKHTVNFVLYVGYNILFSIISLIQLFIMGIEINYGEFLKLQAIFFIVALTIPYSQLLFHLIIKNGLLAISLTIITIFLILIKDNIPSIITLFIPIFYVDNVWMDITNLKLVIIYCTVSILYFLVIFLISIKTNYYNYE
ncbi:MAG: ABC transporter permease [Psychrobacillus sp.]